MCKLHSETNTKIMKTLKFSKDKFESKIETHFLDNGVYDYLEDGKESFKLWFEETIHATTYQFDVEYSPDYDGVYYADEITCTTENKPVELTLKVTNFNPNKQTLSQTLQEIIEKQIQRDEENKQSAKDIEQTNDILNQKYR